jgi:predicted nuclease of predicted toxin-antitoxin system
VTLDVFKMRILFDQGTPAPLRTRLIGHIVETAFELGWSNLKNGELLAMAENSFDLLITTDQQLSFQQNLSGRKLSVLVLMTASWPRIQLHIPRILEAINTINLGDYVELTFQ